MPEEALTSFTVYDASLYLRVRHSYLGQKVGHA